MKQIVAIVLASVTFVTQSHGQGCCGSPGGSPSGSSGSSGSETAFFSGGGTTEAGHSMKFIVDGQSFSTQNGVSFGDLCNTLVNTTDATLPFTRGKTYSITASGWGNAWSVSLGVDAICPCKTEYLGPTHGTGFGSCAGPITGATAIRIADDDDESAAEKENDPDSNSNPSQDQAYNAQYQNSAHVMVDSINWHFSLGGWLPDSKSPGHFALIKEVLDVDTFKKSSLEFTTGASSTYVSQINNPASFPTATRWQVLTPEWVVDIQDNATTGGYDLNLYHKGQTAFDGTYWTNSTAPPAVKWSIQNPDVGMGLYNRLQIQQVRDGLTRTWLYQYSYTTTGSGVSRVCGGTRGQI